MKRQIPEHGCARCMWWRYNSTNGWGRCVLRVAIAWYQHGPCVDYEMDAEVGDEIEVNL